MRKTALLSVLLVLLLAGTSWAVDFDELFGGDLLVELEVDEGALAPEEALLVQDRLDLGGSYNFSLRASRTFRGDTEPEDRFRASLDSQLYLDARPDPNFRAFGKVGLGYDASGGEDAFKSKLLELFADFNYDNKVFFRAGKQNVKWGVGYFFSPADIINIGRIDPLDPEAEREGPVTLKVHYPKGSSNFYLYSLFDGVKELKEIALAPKLEFVVGKTEFGLGGFYRQDEPPRLMATVSSSFGEVGFFGEAVLSFGTERGFLEPRGPVYEVVERDGVFLQATAGGMYRFKDDTGRFDLAATVQYYFNGEGYRDQEGIKKVRLALLNQQLPPVVNPLKLGSVALVGSGRHYAAGALNWNRILGSKLSASLLLTANLSDQSGLIQGTLRLPAVGKITPASAWAPISVPPAASSGRRGAPVRCLPR
ncbi:DUF1302 domain-containing protein [Candidatus Darwinibacter acetoxidans]